MVDENGGEYSRIADRKSGDMFCAGGCRPAGCGRKNVSDESPGDEVGQGGVAGCIHVLLIKRTRRGHTGSVQEEGAT